MRGNKRSPRPLLLLVVAFSALTGLLMGFDLSVIAVVLNPIQTQFNLCPPNAFTCFKREFFVSMIAPGALIGSLGGGYLADLIGRRLTLALSDLCFIFGSILFCIANNFLVLVLGRIVVGAGVGIGFVVFSTYVTELSPASMRGRLVLCQEIAQCLGVLITFAIATIIGNSHWRLLLAGGGAVGLIQLAAIPGLPESPCWLILRGEIEQARKTLRRLGIRDHELLADRTPERHSTASVVDRLLQCKGPLVTACFVGFAQNVLCTNAVLYYSTDLFLLAGVCKCFQWGLGLGVMKLIGTLITFNLVDRVGRRALLLGGTLGLTSCHLLLAGAYHLSPYGHDVETAWQFCASAAGANLGFFGLAGWYSVLMLVGIFGFVLGWEVSWAGLMFVVASEILPSSIRGVGMGSVVFCFWVSLFVSQLLFEALFQWVSMTGTFIGLSVAGVFIAVVTYISVPDMTGQPLRSTSMSARPSFDILPTGVQSSSSTAVEDDAKDEIRHLHTNSWAEPDMASSSQILYRRIH